MIERAKGLERKKRVRIGLHRYANEARSRGKMYLEVLTVPFAKPSFPRSLLASSPCFGLASAPGKCFSHTGWYWK